ncbi:Sulfurtransferase|nr:Sulfurtransferase [Candidatus Pantoea persica]
MIDHYRRPYEGTDIGSAVMQAYLEWEYGLVAQLDRDGTHGFRVWRPERQRATVPAQGGSSVALVARFTAVFEIA